MNDEELKTARALCDAATSVLFGDPRLPSMFWIRVVRGDSCWWWTGTLDKNGYGRMRQGRRHIGAHRFVLASLGADIEGKVVMHGCDEPRCVNPAHLSVGTVSDNQSDSVKKGRHACVKRTHCPAGHSYAEHGVIRNGKRYCRPCQSAASLRYQRRTGEDR